MATFADNAFHSRKSLPLTRRLFLVYHMDHHVFLTKIRYREYS